MQTCLINPKRLTFPNLTTCNPMVLLPSFRWTTHNKVQTPQVKLRTDSSSSVRLTKSFPSEKKQKVDRVHR